MASVMKEQKIRTSRVGKKPVPVPAGVDVNIEDQRVTLKGKKGVAELQVHPWVLVQRDGADRVADQTQGGVADRGGHASHLAVATLADG